MKIDILIEHTFLRDKGTNRAQFIEGIVDKYSWIGCGSSYLPGEIISAFLWAQMQNADKITSQRVKIWNKYYEAFATLESEGYIKTPRFT